MTTKALNEQLDKLTKEELDALATEGRKLERNKIPKERQREYMQRFYARQALATRIQGSKAVK